MPETRRQRRRPIDHDVVLSWQDRQGPRVLRARALDLSESGLRIEAEEPLAVGAQIFIRVPDLGLGGAACVRHCTKRSGKYSLGLELSTDHVGGDPTDDDVPDYYEVLQISPLAETETIHRVYKLLAARYHPDNQHTGNAEQFLELAAAYQTLSDPDTRAAYDMQHRRRSGQPLVVFRTKEFVSGVDAEANRRLGILCLLYKRRVTNPDRPGLTLLDLENLMAIPREHLEFTVWYLKEKRYLRTEHNSESEITADGVELVESSLPVKSIVQRLLGAAHEEPEPVLQEA